jgi:hypothetical protein
MPTTKPTLIRPAKDAPAVDHWIATEGVARFDAHAAAPTKTMSSDEARRRLRRHVAGRAANKKA